MNYQLCHLEDSKILQSTLNSVFLGIFCWQTLRDCLRQLLWGQGVVEDIRRTKLVSIDRNKRNIRLNIQGLYRN